MQELSTGIGEGLGRVLGRGPQALLGARAGAGQLNVRTRTSVGGQHATTPERAFSRRASGSSCLLGFLRLPGLSQKQRGFGLRRQYAPDTLRSLQIQP